MCMPANVADGRLCLWEREQNKRPKDDIVTTHTIRHYGILVTTFTDHDILYVRAMRRCDRLRLRWFLSIRNKKQSVAGTMWRRSTTKNNSQPASQPSRRRWIRSWRKHTHTRARTRSFLFAEKAHKLNTQHESWDEEICVFFCFIFLLLSSVFQCGVCSTSSKHSTIDLSVLCV